MSKSRELRDIGYNVGSQVWKIRREYPYSSIQEQVGSLLGTMLGRVTPLDELEERYVHAHRRDTTAIVNALSSGALKDPDEALLARRLLGIWDDNRLRTRQREIREGKRRRDLAAQDVLFYNCQAKIYEDKQI